MPICVILLILRYKIKIKVMTYSEKVKGSKVVYDAICGMKDNDELKVYYGVGFKGVKMEYRIKAYQSDASMEMSYSIWTNFQGMNIGSLSKTMAKAYTYDMMTTRTNYNFKLYEMTLVDS